MIGRVNNPLITLARGIEACVKNFSTDIKSIRKSLVRVNANCVFPIMTLRNSFRLLASCLLLLCSVASRTLIWCWLAPPTAFSFFGTSGKKKNSPARKLSSPVHNLKPSYDVVVIGSGYGGGVAASRMARAQPTQSVCVLESGEERWPEELGYWYGGFPSSALQVLLELRVTGHLCSRLFKPWPVAFGKANGLYKWICGRDSNAFVANGEYTANEKCS
jgi:hypothetical protein